MERSFGNRCRSPPPSIAVHGMTDRTGQYSDIGAERQPTSASGARRLSAANHKWPQPVFSGHSGRSYRVPKPIAEVMKSTCVSRHSGWTKEGLKLLSDVGHDDRKFRELAGKVACKRVPLLLLRGVSRECVAESVWNQCWDGRVSSRKGRLDGPVQTFWITLVAAVQVSTVNDCGNRYLTLATFESQCLFPSEPDFHWPSTGSRWPTGCLSRPAAAPTGSEPVLWTRRRHSPFPAARLTADVRVAVTETVPRPAEGELRFVTLAAHGPI